MNRSDTFVWMSALVWSRARVIVRGTQACSDNHSNSVCVCMCHVIQRTITPASIQKCSGHNPADKPLLTFAKEDISLFRQWNVQSTLFRLELLVSETLGKVSNRQKFPSIFCLIWYHLLNIRPQQGIRVVCRRRCLLVFRFRLKRIQCETKWNGTNR